MIKQDLLQSQLHKAIKNDDKTAKRVIRLIISSIQLAEVAKGKDLSETEFVGIIQKEIKTKLDSLSDAKKAGRIELENEALSDIDLLKQYLPKQISEDELRSITKQIITETDPTSMKDMGKLIQLLIKKLEGSASNQAASKMVKELLEEKLNCNDK